MANIVTITHSISQIAPALHVADASGNYTLVGNFSYYSIGRSLYITGSSSILKYDLTTDTATVNGVTGLTAKLAVDELNKQFVK
jgi:hypothetical protein